MEKGTEAPKTKKMDVRMAVVPVVYLNELLTLAAKQTYEEAAPVITKVTSSVTYTMKEMDVAVEPEPTADSPAEPIEGAADIESSL